MRIDKGWTQVPSALVDVVWAANWARLAEAHPEIERPTEPPECTVYTGSGEGWGMQTSNGRSWTVAGQSWRVAGRGHDLSGAIDTASLDEYLAIRDPALCHVALGSLDDLLALWIFGGYRHSATLPGYRQQVYIAELQLDVLSLVMCTPLGQICSAPGTHLFAGADAHTRLRRYLSHPLTPQPMILAGFSPIGQHRIHEIYTKRASELSGAIADNNYYYRGHPALRERMKIMVTSTRFSTVVGQVGLDLANAIEAIGHEPIVVREENNDQQLTRHHIARVIEDEKPDAAIVISRTRPHLGCYPDGLPFIAWIQDRLPDAADPAMIAQLRADTDISLGVNHSMVRWLRELGHPNVELLTFGASDFRYYREPRERGDWIAYACNLTDTMPLPFAAGVAEYMRSELQNWLGELDFTYDDITRTYQEGIARHRWPLTEGTAKYDAGRRLAQAISRDTHRIAIAEWIRDEGLPLRIYGRGWDRHAGWEKIWCGYAEPGEQLRRVYTECAAVLHVGTNMHQRVVEASLCGAPVVIRRDYDDAQPGGVDGVFPGDMLMRWETREELMILLREVVAHQARHLACADEARGIVLEGHTYRHRAQSIIDAVRSLRS